MKPVVFSQTYPPKNRVETGLDTLEIELVDRDGKHLLDPNGAADAAWARSLPLGESLGPSILSGEPGFGYRTCEVDLVLSRDEILRLLRRELRPTEVRQLLELQGAFFELHDDFYDEQTFEALQPMEALE